MTIRSNQRRSQQVVQKAGRAVAIASWSENGDRLALTLSQTPPSLPTGLWRLAQGVGPDAGKLVFELHRD